MEDDDLTLDLTTYPREGDQSEVRSVVFGPASDEFTFLAEVNAVSGHINVTIGNAPATSLLPTFIPEMLRELAEEFSHIADNPQFLEWIYGEQTAEYDEE